MTTETQDPTTDDPTKETINANSTVNVVHKSGWNPRPVLATTYSFPSLEPIRFVEYPHNHLFMPLRKDLLHRAVIYEGDKTRQGTASTKWRDDVHGSGRKLYAQKGSGKARVGDKKSPIRRGGGVAHGPHPRDFSTGLPRKIYDQAWRIALSYRYRRGQLIIIEGKMSLPDDATPHLINEMLGSRISLGDSTLITDKVDDRLFAAVRALEDGKEVKKGRSGRKKGKNRGRARILDRADVDVKDLLKTRRLIVEKEALDKILAQHSKDLKGKPATARY